MLEGLECPDDPTEVGPSQMSKAKVKAKTGKAAAATPTSAEHTNSARRRRRRLELARRNLLKPADQMILSDPELREEILQCLTAVDPCRSKNLVVWDYNERSYIPLMDTEPMTTIWHMDSQYLYNKSDEMKAYKGELMDGYDGVETPSSSKSLADQKQLSKGAGGTEGDKLMNLFNCCTRASQTINQPLREEETQTEPPVLMNFKGVANRWIIRDAFEEDKGQSASKPAFPPKATRGNSLSDIESSRPATNATDVNRKNKKEVQGGGLVIKPPELEKVRFRRGSEVEGQAAIEASMAKATGGLSVAERVVAQNVFAELLDDFKYYEDDSDIYRDGGEGTLLPLWRFVYEKAVHLQVTDIAWAKSSPDIFAVTFGSFNFVNANPRGLVLIVSLRNMTYPEQVWPTERGAMAIDIHKGDCCLAAVGLNDGNVGLLNLKKNKGNQPMTEIFKNSPTVLKHGCPVWSVKWCPNEVDPDVPNFISAGMDGKLIQWRIGLHDMQGGGGLEGTEISTLILPREPEQGPDGTILRLFGCARCIDFHPTEKFSFVAGSAEGHIFLGSSLYSSYFPKIYSAHFLPVSSVQWNPFHPEVFLSSSEDWTIKIWTRSDLSPMYTFEIGLAILDAAWAPYSSTVLAAVTEEGKVLVYDINVNSEKPICSQQVVTRKKFKPHRAKFNPTYPIIIIGDDRGQLLVLKMSPNLRILARNDAGQPLEGAARDKFEIDKLNKLLRSVRDPESITDPKIIPGPGGDHRAIGDSSDDDDEVGDAAAGVGVEGLGPPGGQGDQDEEGTISNISKEKDEKEDKDKDNNKENKEKDQVEEMENEDGVGSEGSVGDLEVGDDEGIEGPQGSGLELGSASSTLGPEGAHSSHTTTSQVEELDSFADEGSELGGEKSVEGISKKNSRRSSASASSRRSSKPGSKQIMEEMDSFMDEGSSLGGEANEGEEDEEEEG